MLSSREKNIGLLLVYFVGFAYSCNYTNQAPLIPLLIKEFGFTKAMAGLLATGMFLTHAAMQIPGGHLADKFGGRKVMVLSLLVVVIGNVCIANSYGYHQLLFWKVFIGLGTGTSFIAGARYISQLVSDDTLAKAQGYYGATILLGSGFVIFIVPRIAEYTNWRGAFITTASVAFMALILWIAFAPKPKMEVHPPIKMSKLLLHPQLWLLGLVQMASFGLVIVIGNWITILLKQQLQINNPLLLSTMASLVILLGVVGRPLGGFLVEKIGVRKILEISFLFNTIGCLLLAFVGNSFGFTFLAIVLLGFGCGLPYATLFNRATILFPGRAGAAKGLVNMLGVIMILIGAPLVGYVADVSGKFTNAFIALGFFSFIVWIISFKLKK
jgi:NNP family nitrate/nitrite transporter-like MFS transporter